MSIILNLHFQDLSDFQIHNLWWFKVMKLKFVSIRVEIHTVNVL